MASEEYTESEISKIVKRLMDEEGFEFGEAVREAMEQTKKFESKADGGSIGIEILFEPKREKFSIGGRTHYSGSSNPLATYKRQGYQVQKNPPRYDSRATAQDYTNALKNVSAGTTNQQQADSKRYARQEANRMLTDAFRSGNQQSIQNLYNQFGFNATAPGSQLFNRGTTSGTLNQIIGLPYSKKDQVLDQMVQRMLSYPTKGSSAPMKKSPLQLKIEENQRLFNEYVKNNPPLTGIITGPKGGTPTSPGLPPYLDKNLLSQLTMLTPEEAFAGETFDTLSDLDQYNFAQAFTQFKPQLRDPTYVSPYGIDDQQIFSRRYGIKDGGRVPALSGGLMKLLAESAAKGKKGIMELVETGKGKFDEFVETQTSKKPSDSFTPQNITADLIDGPITVEKMANLDSKTLNIIKNTYDNGLYKEMPEILKAGNLLERFTKVVKGERIIDYERAEAILGVPLKGDETLNDLFKIEFNTRPVETMADGGRVGLFMGGPPLEGQALSIYDSMNKYGFSDQEIANALAERGLYTPGGTTEETEIIASAPNIINQQTGGDGPPGPAPTGTKTYGKTFTGMTMPDGTPIGSSGVVEGPGIIDGLKNAATGLFDLYQKFSPFGIVSKFMKDRAEKQETLQNNAIEKARKEREMQQAIKDAEAAQAALDNAVRTGRRPGSGSGPTTKDDGGGSAGTGGYSYDAGGREGFGYGLKEGGLATMFTRRR